MNEYTTMRDIRNLEDQRDFAMDEMERLVRERDGAREDAKRATYDATQETLKVGAVKGAWIEACRERDEAREELRTARNLADAAIWESDRLRSKLWRACDRE
jgi:hypothetical protein